MFFFDFLQIIFFKLVCFFMMFTVLGWPIFFIMIIIFYIILKPIFLTYNYIDELTVDIAENNNFYFYFNQWKKISKLEFLKRLEINSIKKIFLYFIYFFKNFFFY